MTASLLIGAGVAGLSDTAQAQVLARPGWAGSGVTLEPWWAHAAFYRIDVARFQDSDGDGVGDLRGLAQRMDYLQELGVDALVLEPQAGKVAAAATGPAAPIDFEGFDEVVRAATARRMRVLVELDLNDAHVAEAARAWLTQGAAGVYVDLRDVGGRSITAALRRVTDGFPGGRILMAAGPADAEIPGAQLVVASPVQASTGVAGLRVQMQQDLLAMDARGGRERRGVVLRVERVTGTAAEDVMGAARTSSLLVLASRGAVMLDYGAELGLESAAGGADPLMQWTMSDVTPKAIVAAKLEPVAPEPVYKAYRPYVPPLPQGMFPAPKMPEAVFSDAPPPVPVAMLPGFTTGALPAGVTGTNAAAANVVDEDADKGSVLQMTRRLLQLRHDNSSLRNGSERLIDRDALGALVWVRGVPVGTRTSGTVVAVANLSGVPLFLSLTDAVPGRGASAPVRNLLGGGVQSLGQIRVLAHEVFLGELGR